MRREENVRKEENVGGKRGKENGRRMIGRKLGEKKSKTNELEENG